jgi:hypothetical protein
MHRDHHVTFAPLFMFMAIEAAALVGQPFPECCALHFRVPVFEVTDAVRSPQIIPKKKELVIRAGSELSRSKMNGAISWLSANAHVLLRPLER